MKTHITVFILSLLLLPGCKKGELPDVETLDVEYYASTKATIGYNLHSDGGATVTSSGLIIGTTENLEASGVRYEMGVDQGEYFGQLSGLLPDKQYFIKAFSINEVGESFGELKSFTTPVKVTDFDNNSYETVVIGNQVWMAKNLETTHYQNGDLIVTTDPSSLNIENEVAPKYQWVYNGENSNLPEYGRLYTWYAATDPRDVCPTGWHIPSDAEWTILEAKLGGYTTAGSKLKEINNDHWLSPYNKDASDLSCFTGLPGGYRDWTGISYQIQNNGYFWSDSDSEPSKAYSRALNATLGEVGRLSMLKNYGVSIRCIKD